MSTIPFSNTLRLALGFGVGMVAALGNIMGNNYSAEIERLRRETREAEERYHRDKEEAEKAEARRQNDILAIRVAEQLQQLHYDMMEIRNREQELERIREKLRREEEERQRRLTERLNYPVPEWLTTYVADVENLRGEKEFVNIGIVGGSGVGKSRFINSVRGFPTRASAPSPAIWAEVGETETTIIPRPFKFTSAAITGDRPTVNLFDLPGVGTPRFPAEDYFKTVGLRHFDAVFIMSANRFTENDLMLRDELVRVNLPHYFIRNQVDRTVEENEDVNGISETATLQQIRMDLRGQGVMNPYLVSSKFVQRYDMPHLIQQLNDVLVRLAEAPEGETEVHSLQDFEILSGHSMSSSVTVGSN